MSIIINQQDKNNKESIDNNSNNSCNNNNNNNNNSINYIEIINQLESNDNQIVYECLKKFNHRFEQDQQQLIDSGILKVLVQLFIKYSNLSTLEIYREGDLVLDCMFYVTLVINDLTLRYKLVRSSLADNGFIAPLVESISSNHIIHITSLLISTLSNICQNKVLKSSIFQTNILDSINQILDKVLDKLHHGYFDILIIKEIVILYRLILLKEPYPNSNSISRLFPYVIKLFKVVSDRYSDNLELELILSAILKLTNISIESLVRELVTFDFLDRIIEATYHKNNKVNIGALKIMVNISSTMDRIGDQLIHSHYRGFLKRLCSLLSSPQYSEISIKTITNIADYGEIHSKDIINSGIVNKIYSILQNDKYSTTIDDEIVLNKDSPVPSVNTTDKDSTAPSENTTDKDSTTPVNTIDNDSALNSTLTYSKKLSDGMKREFIYSICSIIINSDYLNMCKVLETGILEHLASFLNGLVISLIQDSTSTTLEPTNNNQEGILISIQETLENLIDSALRIVTASLTHNIHNVGTAVKDLPLVNLLLEYDIFKLLVSFLSIVNNNPYRTQQLSNKIYMLFQLLKVR